MSAENISDHEDNDELITKYDKFFKTPHKSKINNDKTYGLISLYYEKSVMIKFKEEMWQCILLMVVFMSETKFSMG